MSRVRLKSEKLFPAMGPCDPPETFRKQSVSEQNQRYNPMPRYSITIRLAVLTVKGGKQRERDLHHSRMDTIVNPPE